MKDDVCVVKLINSIQSLRLFKQRRNLREGAMEFALLRLTGMAEAASRDPEQGALLSTGENIESLSMHMLESKDT